jgi:hypothetical protein
MNKSPQIIIKEEQWNHKHRPRQTLWQQVEGQEKPLKQIKHNKKNK